MTQIYKYKLKQYELEQTLAMPEGATIVSCQLQYGDATIWALVEEHNALVPRTFVQVVTGQSLPLGCELKHLATLQKLDGAFVYHVFEKVTS